MFSAAKSCSCSKMNGSKSSINFSTRSRLRSAFTSGAFFSGSGDMIRWMDCTIAFCAGADIRL